MATTTADLETGTNGSTILTSDTGSATAFQLANVGTGATLTYDASQQAHGSLSANCGLAGSSKTAAIGWDTSFGTQSGTHFGRFYLRLSAVPSLGAIDIMQPSVTDYTVGNRGALMQVNTTGKIQFQDSVGPGLTSTNSLSANTWYRIEYKIVQSATVGLLEVKIYSTVDGTTALETQTSSANKNTKASVDHICFGQNRTASSDTLNVWFDNLVAGAASYPGPFPVSTTAPTVSGLAPVGSTLTCDGGTWNNGGTFTLSYQWTRDGANIAAATSSTYTTVAADAGHAVGCTVTATGTVATNESATRASSNTVTVTGAAPNDPAQAGSFAPFYLPIIAGSQ